MSDQKNNLPAERLTNNNLATFVAGVVIGAALTYLFGTKSGQKVKDQLLKDGTKLLETMTEEIEEKVQELESQEPKIKEPVESQEEETVKEAAPEVPPHIEEIQKKGRRFFFRKPRAES